MMGNENSAYDSSSDEQNSRENRRADSIPMCSFGLACYRKNPAHFREFRHPHKDANGLPKNLNSNEKIEIKIEIGHKSVPLPERNAAGNTHDLTVFVRGVAGNMIEPIIDRVIFCFTNRQMTPTYIVGIPPFTIQNVGHESTVVAIDIYFKNRTGIDTVHYDYNVSIQEKTMVEHVRHEKMTFLNPDSEFRHNLMRAGGFIVAEASSSSPSSEAGPSRRKRKRSNEGGRQTDEYDTFGSQCAIRLRNVNSISPRQKIIAEKLISDVLCYAQLKTLTTNSCIDSLKRSNDFYIPQIEDPDDDLTQTGDDDLLRAPTDLFRAPTDLLRAPTDLLRASIKKESLGDNDISIKDEPLTDDEVSLFIKKERLDKLFEGEEK